MSADITEMFLDDHDWFRRQSLRLADLREQPDEAAKVWDSRAPPTTRVRRAHSRASPSAFSRPGVSGPP